MREQVEIGSSDAPVILGVSPHSTPWQLWGRLVGLIPKVDEPDEVMRAGSRLEPVVIVMVLDEIADRGDAVQRSPNTRAFSDKRPWQRSTPDAILVNPYASPENLIEVKCVIGQPPSAPRVEWVVQSLHHLLVFDQAEACHLACFGGLRLVRWEIPRHQGALDAVLRAEEEFLEMVEKETPPPVSARDASVLWRAWPLVKEETKVLPMEARGWDREMVEAGALADEYTARYELARTRIKAALGDNIRGVLPDGSASYKWAPDKRGVRSLRRHGREGE